MQAVSRTVVAPCAIIAMVVPVAAVSAGDPPANDACVDAESVVAGITAFDTIGATTDGSELVLVCDQGNGAQIESDVWFIWEAPGVGVVEFSTCPGADFDTFMAVYHAGDGKTCPGDLIDCSDDSTACDPGLSLLPQYGPELAVEPGDQLLIRIGSGDGSQGSGQLLVEFDEFVPPANDDCVNAMDVFEGSTSFSTEDASTDGDPLVAVCDQGNGAQIQSDVWFRWTATATGTVEISTCQGADFDTYIAVYSAPEGDGCGDLIDCSDDSIFCDAGLSLLPQFGPEIAVEAGEALIIRVGSGDGSQGSGELTIEFDEFLPPANDDCVNALDVGEGDTAFSTEDASTDGEALPAVCDQGSGAQIQSDVWFRWTAPALGTVVISTCQGADFDTYLAVYHAPQGEGCGDLIDCSDDSAACDPGLSLLPQYGPAITVQAGDQLLIRAGSGDGSQGSGVLTIEFDAQPTPSNDECFLAQPVATGSTFFSTEDATTDGLPLSCEGAAVQIESDVWFLYEAPCDGTGTVSLCDQASFDTLIAVYDADVPVESSSCCSLNNMPGCDDPECEMAVCAVDPFCCDIQWDNLCADEAKLLCGDLCVPANCPPTNDDLVGCNDDSIECSDGTSRLEWAIVGGQSYLVRVGGGSGAIGEGGILSVSFACSDPPANDDCAGAIAIDGPTAFTTIAATTDGLPLIGLCDEGNGEQIEHDVWFTWTAPCAGIVSFSTCTEADFDTSLAAYRSDEQICPPTNDALIDCSDDSALCDPGLSLIPQFGGDIVVAFGEEIIVRVGSAAGITGSGTLSVDLLCACPEDVNGDGVIDVQDLTEVILQWATDDQDADVNGDGTVDVQDLTAVILAWGPCDA